MLLMDVQTLPLWEMLPEAIMLVLAGELIF